LDDTPHPLAISVDAGIAGVSRPGVGNMNRLVPRLRLTGGEGNCISALQIIRAAPESNSGDETYKQIQLERRST
jgi:hypothetical protein